MYLYLFRGFFSPIQIVWNFSIENFSHFFLIYRRKYQIVDDYYFMSYRLCIDLLYDTYIYIDNLFIFEKISLSYYQYYM